MDNAIMNVGRFRGVPVKKIPREHLVWLKRRDADVCNEGFGKRLAYGDLRRNRMHRFLLTREMCEAIDYHLNKIPTGHV